MKADKSRSFYITLDFCHKKKGIFLGSPTYSLTLLTISVPFHNLYKHNLLTATV